MLRLCCIVELYDVEKGCFQDCLDYIAFSSAFSMPVDCRFSAGLQLMDAGSLQRPRREGKSEEPRTEQVRRIDVLVLAAVSCPSSRLAMMLMIELVIGDDELRVAENEEWIDVNDNLGQTPD